MKDLLSLMNLIRVFIIPYFRKHLLRIILSILGVSLGVAVYVAIQSANTSARRAMGNFVTSLSSGSDLTIRYGRNGFDEAHYPVIVNTKGVKNAIPFVSARTRVIFHKKYFPVMILGVNGARGGYLPEDSKDRIDLERFFSLPNQAIVTEGFLNYHGLKKDSRIKIATERGEIDFEIAAVIKKSQTTYGQNKDIIFLDIFSAQYYFKKEGRLDKIDIQIKKGVSIEEVIQSLRNNLKEDLLIQTPRERLGGSGQLYRSFQLNLTVVSLISLIVGMFLIFNTINTSILHQRKEIGILRSLGVTKKNILILFIFEGLIIGIIGSILGILLGWLLSYLSVDIFTQKISQEYILKDVREIEFNLFHIISGLLLGIGTTFVSSVIPSVSAVKISPVETIRSVSYENQKQIHVKPYSIIGILLLIMAFILSIQKPIFNLPIFAFLSGVFITLGLSFLAPKIILITTDTLKPFLIKLFRIEMSIANLNISRSLGRNSITSSTLMISISLIISIFTLIASYEYSINNWMDQVNNADYSILSGSSYREGDIFPMDERRIDKIRRLPDIRDIDEYRFYTTSYKGLLLDIHSFKMEVASKYVHYTFLEGNQSNAFKIMTYQEGVLISDSISNRFNLHLGDKISLHTKSGTKDFIIAGVVYNYLSNNGVISMPRNTFRQYWKDHLVDIFKIYLMKGTDFDSFTRTIYSKLDNPDTLIYTSLNKFKKEISSAIKETFYIFHALEMITIVIAFMGLVNVLLSSILERRREMGIYRSIGATKLQISKMVLSEAGIIGFISSILGVIGGIILSLITVLVINKQTLGWYLEYHFPVYLIAIIPILIIILSVISGIYPAKKAQETVIREALEYE